MNKSAVIGSVIGAAIVTTVGAVAGYRVVEASRGAEVVSVKAVSRTVSTPRQECHDEQVTHTKPVKDKDRLLGTGVGASRRSLRSEEHTSELQSHVNLVCRLLLEKKKKKKKKQYKK